MDPKHYVFLPPFLESITFPNTFNQSIHDLPPHLIFLQLGEHFNQPLILPNTLQQLYLSTQFNHPIPFLPPLIQIVHIDSMYFNHPIDHFPNSIHTLHLGNGFNQPVQKWPSNLKHLTLGKSFEQPLEHLPDTLESLYLSNPFDHPFHFPSQLKTLHLPSSYSHPLPWNQLPISFKTCILSRNYMWTFCDELDELSERKIHIQIYRSYD
jgi:hypothetical protein